MRNYNYEIMDVIKDRWSPRAFSREAVNQEDLNAIMEAARFAPSCFNEQPWLYMVASEEKSLQVLQSLLMEKNLMWAKNAPVLILVLCKDDFDHNGKENKYCKFDTGTSWGFLSLEATRRGYYTHAMAGFKKKSTRRVLNLPENYHPIAMVALGKPGDIHDLDESFRKDESPSSRKPLEEVMVDISHFGGPIEED